MKRFKKLGLGFLALLAFMSLSLSLVVGFSQRVYAATGTWIDAGAIEVNGEIYIDNEVGDGMHYYLGGVDDDCTSVIQDFSADYWDANYASATLFTKVRDPFDRKICDESSEPITLGDTGKARLWFSWVDAGEIEMLVNNKRSFAAVPDRTGVFAELIDSDCRSDVTIPDPVNNPGVGNYTIRVPLSGCSEAMTDQVALDTTNARLPAGSGTSNSGNTMEDTCESRTPGWGWLLCSGIDLLDGGLNFVDNQIQRLLEVNHDRYTNEGLRDAWGIFRNIAYIILIPIMLVMVIGTAIGVEAFSAYTVRKALPRMVVAIIFITLSWYICTFLIGFFNTMGSGVMGLATAPFRAQAIDPACQGNNLNLACMFSYSNDFSSIGSGSASILRNLVTTVANVGLAVGVVIFVIFSFGTLLGGAILGLLVLFLREMFILGLLLLSPLAILAWIFPGNDKLWQWWWGLFSKLLIMYPLIMGLLAAGRIFAWIINVSPAGPGEAIIQPIMKLAAYMLPYALIPLTFKFAGGMFANIAGMVNDRERGLLDRWKNLRNTGLKKAWSRTQEGRALGSSAPEGSRRARFNASTQRLSNIHKAGLTLNRERRRARLDSALATSDLTAARTALRENEALSVLAGNEDYAEAGRSGRGFVRNADGDYVDETGQVTNDRARMVRRDGSERAVRAYLASRGYGEEDVQSVMHAKRGISQEVFNMAALLSIPGTGTGFGGGAGEMDAAINETVGHNRRLAATVLAEMRGTAERVGRSDLKGGGFNRRRIALQEQYEAEMAAEEEFRAGRITFDQLQSRYADISAGTTEAVTDMTIYSTDSRGIAGMKPRQIRERVVPMVQAQLAAAYASGDQRAIDQQLAKVASLYDQAQYASPEVQEIIEGLMNSTVQGVHPIQMVPGPDGTPVPTQSVQTIDVNVRNEVETARGRDSFLNFRRELGSGRRPLTPEEAASMTEQERLAVERQLAAEAEREQQQGQR